MIIHNDGDFRLNQEYLDDTFLFSSIIQTFEILL